jgi:hypothetical protein
MLTAARSLAKPGEAKTNAAEPVVGLKVIVQTTTNAPTGK